MTYLMSSTSTVYVPAGRLRLSRLTPSGSSRRIVVPTTEPVEPGRRGSRSRYRHGHGADERADERSEPEANELSQRQVLTPST